MDVWFFQLLGLCGRVVIDLFCTLELFCFLQLWFIYSIIDKVTESAALEIGSWMLAEELATSKATIH